jgi:hypothetical protein
MITVKVMGMAKCNESKQYDAFCQSDDETEFEGRDNNDEKEDQSPAWNKYPFKLPMSCLIKAPPETCAAFVHNLVFMHSLFVQIVPQLICFAK